MNPPGPDDRHARRILVVEDDRDLLSIVERVALSLDPSLVVDSVSSVAAARQLLCSRRYALILSDYLLEDRASGLALRAWCQRSGVTVPFAMMSAFPIENEIGGPATSCPFLRKPFSLSKLRDFMQTMLESTPGLRHPS